MERLSFTQIYLQTQIISKQVPFIALLITLFKQVLALYYIQYAEHNLIFALIHFHNNFVLIIPQELNQQ